MGVGGGDGLGLQGIHLSPTRSGSILHQVRIHPPAICAASWSAYLAALGVQVWEARRSWGDIDQDLGALSTRCGGWALGRSQEVHQLFPEFDGRANQGGAVRWVEARRDCLLVHDLKFSLRTENHATRESQPRCGKDRFIPHRSPGEALRAHVGCH